MKPYASDDELQRDVLEELRWDTRVDSSAIGVIVHDGIVTLTGDVSTYAAKLAAAEAAHRVWGIKDVANDVRVKLLAGNQRTDADLAASVRHALEWDVSVPDEQIGSTVSNGLVTLTGSVNLASQREDAARAVRNLAGVRGVENRLTLDGQAVTPGVIRSAIEQALERHVDRETKRIEIDVDGGLVTLRGSVGSWSERQAAIGAAWGTRGVENVVDRMTVGR